MFWDAKFARPIFRHLTFSLEYFFLKGNLIIVIQKLQRYYRNITTFILISLIKQPCADKKLMSLAAEPE